MGEYFFKSILIRNAIIAILVTESQWYSESDAFKVLGLMAIN
jgi:hypothetical protein